MMKFFRKILHFLGFQNKIKIVPMKYFIGSIVGEFDDVRNKFDDIKFKYVAIVNIPEEFNRICIWHDFNSIYWVVEYFEKPE